MGAEASSCVTFADSYTQGTCAGAGYSVACPLRYGIVENYKTQKECNAAKDKALHRRLGGQCYRMSGGSCHEAAEANSCSTFADSYTQGTCAGAGYSVSCALRYGIVENYRTKKECDAAKDHALHRRLSGQCYRISGGSCHEAAEADTCQT